MGGEQRRALIFALVFLAALLAAVPAHAEFPGRNGKIVYSNGFDLWLIDPDGTNEQNLTNNTGPSTQAVLAPEWSPDGSKIAVTNSNDIFVLNADGSGLTNITDGIPGQPAEPAGYFYNHPSWSPDGTRIAFDRAFHDGAQWDLAMEVWVADADGSNAARLATSTASAAHPKWHPDGTRIAFHDCSFPCHDPSDPWTIGPDGSGQEPLPAPSIDDWSPDGTKIVFRAPGMEQREDVFVQNIDGTGQVQLTNTFHAEGFASWSPDGTQLLTSGARPVIMNADGSDYRRLTQSAGGNPDWQPIPINAYPRPKGASPQRLALVPAYTPCTAPNRTHGVPLAFPSCHPPVKVSEQLTLGTPDANGRPAKSVSHVRINPVRGLPGTAEDEADVRIRGVIDDVRLASDLSDFAGDLELRLSIRITDKDNTPHPGGPGAATVQELTHSHPLACTATADTTVGSRCEFDTTVEALVPGAVKEQRRAIWELDRVTVHDQGGDVFLTQGVFIP